MRKYSVELKQQVIGAWQAGNSENELVKTFGVPKSTLRGWVKGRSRTAIAPKKDEPDEDTIDDIAWAHVKAGRTASEAILAKAADARWLDRQNAVTIP